MKSAHVLLATVAIFASAACNAEKATTTNTDAPVAAAVKAPNGDWSKLVKTTDEGGYLMGNPNADVKLVEYGSMTCGHCAEFAEGGAKTVVDKYVKSGRVSFEFRNYVRDPLDITVSLITRCAGPDKFFALTDQAFVSQKEFFQTIQGAPADQQQQLQTLQGPEAFPVYARLAGLQQWASQRGIPSAKLQQCLANKAEVDRLVQMNGDATTQYPEFRGTPTFVVNGTMVQGSTWEILEPELQKALGS